VRYLGYAFQAVGQSRKLEKFTENPCNILTLNLFQTFYVGDKVYNFRTEQEQQAHDCYVQDGPSETSPSCFENSFPIGWTKLGSVKRKVLFDPRLSKEERYHFDHCGLKKLQGLE
jgi:hypothetical protein